MKKDVNIFMKLMMNTLINICMNSFVLFELGKWESERKNERN